MIRKRWLLCLICFWLSPAGAQVSMTLQVPPVGVLVKNQLWNMVVVNSSSLTVVASINLVLLDQNSNQPVLSATTLPISIPKGARQIQARDLGPIQYAYSSPAYQVDGNPNGLLPAGSYQACYTIVSTGKPLTLAENCVDVNVDPLSPPLLNYPPNEGKIYNVYPQFTWLPPTPVGLFNDLSYTLILVRALPGQGSGDAIQENVPVYSEGFINNLYMNYPSSYPALDTGVLYAWRILAMNGNQPEAMSDIWTFRVVKNVPALKSANGDSYLGLKLGQTPSIASSSEVLKLNYTNMAGDTAVQYTITSLQEAGNPTVQQGTLKLRYGQNFLDVALSGGYAQHKVYLFSLVNKRGEAWTLKFTWTPAQTQTVTF